MVFIKASERERGLSVLSEVVVVIYLQWQVSRPLCLLVRTE